MKDALFALLALLSAVAAAFFFWSFQKQNEADAGSMNLILAIVFILLAIAFGAYYMFNRVNRHDEIHVTE